MLLSVVTINRNEAAGLARTLRSVLEEQPGFDDFEQIVVDGASTDGSMDAVGKYAGHPRLASAVSEPDAGIYNAMNKGAARAKGDYLLFLNAGDVLKPGALKDVFAGNPTEDILYGDVDISLGGVCQRRVSPALEELTPGWFLYDSLPHQGCFIARRMHERLGGYDETYRISAAPKFIFLAVFRERATLRRLEMRVSEFDRSGVSSDFRHFDAKMKEWERFLVPYFGKRVVAKAQQGLCNAFVVRSETTALVRRDPALAEEIRRGTDFLLAVRSTRLGRALVRAFTRWMAARERRRGKAAKRQP